MYKNGWKRIDDERIKSIFRDVVGEAKKQGFFSNEQIPDLFSRKSIRFLGSCHYRRSFSGNIDTAIVLNSELFRFSDDQIRATIVHEVAHALLPFSGHSMQWKTIANKIGRKWGIVASRLCQDSEINAEMQRIRREKKEIDGYKYEIFCPNCGKVLNRYKTQCDAVKHPERWRHKICGCILESRKIEQ